MREGDLASVLTATSPAAERARSTTRKAGPVEALVAPRERPAIAALLAEFAVVRRVPRNAAVPPSGVVAWSHSGRRSWAKRRAAALGVPYLLLDSGVLRAPPGWRAADVLSATAKAMGPGSPVDCLDPVRLLANCGWENPSLLARAAAARRDIVSQRLGGAWWIAGADPGLPRGGRLALVIGHESDGFQETRAPPPGLLRTMLAAALAENAPQRIVLLAPGNGVSRDVLKDAAARGCTVLTQPLDVWLAIERAARVYTAGGETGFLALLAGVEIRCFAEAFYSGLGITTDEAAVPRKPLRRTVDEVFAGACLVATRYLDPYRMRVASFEETAELIGEWRKIEAANRRISVCVGMSFWKRRRVRDFLRSGGGIPRFRRHTKAALNSARARPGGAIAVWASRVPADLARATAVNDVPLIRVEDGFIRSVGLGSDFMPAASLVLDSRGMHFDPSVRSDLEIILGETEFDAALIERARRLVAQLVARGVTKYNLGTADISIDWPTGRRRILVPGQVEDDLSVRLGGEGVGGNLDLLKRVRAANPDAFILYKPHPDVEAGHRTGKVPDAIARSVADLVIHDVSTAALLTEIDELHTLTSLAGFEALLRGRRVVVYGRPFYAGWGLTTDLAEIDRGRRLALEELVAGALILYPRYLDPLTRLPCGPELIVERLENPELWRPGILVLARRLQGAFSRLWGELAGVTPRFFAGWPASRGGSRAR